MPCRSLGHALAYQTRGWPWCPDTWRSLRCLSRPSECIRGVGCKRPGWRERRGEVRDILFCLWRELGICFLVSGGSWVYFFVFGGSWGYTLLSLEGLRLSGVWVFASLMILILGCRKLNCLQSRLPVAFLPIYLNWVPGYSERCIFLSLSLLVSQLLRKMYFFLFIYSGFPAV